MSTPIEISEEAGVRYLHFGSEWVQGAMRIRRPNALELVYTQEMMAGLLWHDAFNGGRWPRSALLIGLGAASLTKFIYHYLPHTRLTVVEIEPQVLAVARQFFKLPDENERFNVVIADGVEYVAGHKRRFDCILVDGFDEHARAGGLDTEIFYAGCRRLLTEQGLLAVNLFGKRRGYASSLTRLKTAFDDRVFALPPCESGNVIAFATGGDSLNCSLDEMRERAETLREKTALDLRPSISRLQMTQRLPGGVLSL
jgi:spermidine synthase